MQNTDPPFCSLELSTVFFFFLFFNSMFSERCQLEVKTYSKVHWMCLSCGKKFIKTFKTIFKLITSWLNKQTHNLGKIKSNACKALFCKRWRDTAFNNYVRINVSEKYFLAFPFQSSRIGGFIHMKSIMNWYISSITVYAIYLYRWSCPLTFSHDNVCYALLY